MMWVTGEKRHHAFKDHKNIYCGQQDITNILAWYIEMIALQKQTGFTFLHY